MTKIPIYVIDTGVPLPPEESRARMPLRDLKVGESILFPLEKRPSVQSAVSKLKRETGWNFTIKKQNAEHARVWRTE